MKVDEGRDFRASDKRLARKLERVEKQRNSWREAAEDYRAKLDVMQTKYGSDEEEPWEAHCRRVLGQVFGERHRQVARYGPEQDLHDGTGPDVMWLADTSFNLHALDAADIEAVFRDEYEQYEDGHGKPTWMHLVREEVAEAFMSADPHELEHELIQIAALCVSWVQKLQKERGE